MIIFHVIKSSSFRQKEILQRITPFASFAEKKLGHLRRKRVRSFAKKKTESFAKKKLLTSLTDSFIMSKVAKPIQQFWQFVEADRHLNAI